MCFLLYQVYLRLGWRTRQNPAESHLAVRIQSNTWKSQRHPRFEVSSIQPHVKSPLSRRVHRLLWHNQRHGGIVYCSALWRIGCMYPAAAELRSLTCVGVAVRRWLRRMRATRRWMCSSSPSRGSRFIGKGECYRDTPFCTSSYECAFRVLRATYFRCSCTNPTMASPFMSVWIVNPHLWCQERDHWSSCIMIATATSSPYTTYN